MKTIHDRTKINKKKSEARTAHLQMVTLIIALAVVSFAGGYFVAMTEVAAVVAGN
ncbi:MAG: hypothetical protein M3388_12300 [Acidobacteriota bacterium]|nr:hypothetical protein [Acidobacteriota bacterium]